MTLGQRLFQIHAAAWTATSVFLFVIWLVTTAPGFPWFLFPVGGWGIGIAIHATVLYTKAPEDDELEPGDEQTQLGYRP